LIFHYSFFGFPPAEFVVVAIYIHYTKRQRNPNTHDRKNLSNTYKIETAKKNPQALSGCLPASQKAIKRF